MQYLLMRGIFTSTTLFSWTRRSLRRSGPCTGSLCSTASGDVPSLTHNHRAQSHKTSLNGAKVCFIMAQIKTAILSALKLCLVVHSETQHNLCVGKLNSAAEFKGILVQNICSGGRPHLILPVTTAIFDNTR